MERKETNSIMKDLEDIYTENYLFPQRRDPFRHAEGDENSERVEERILKIKEYLLNIYRGLDTLKQEESLAKLVDILKKQIRPSLRKMGMRITIDQPTQNLSPLELRQKIASIQGQFSAISNEITVLKNVYERHGNVKMIDSLDEVEHIITTPAHSFSKYVFEPIKALL